MPGINFTGPGIDHFGLRIGYAMKTPRFNLPPLLLVALILMLACSFGCAPQYQNSSTSSPDSPELTDEIIRERINETRVRDVPEENGAADKISWGFDEDEPKGIAIIDKQIDGNRATIVLDIKTSSAPRAREQRYLSGQIRTMWELRSGLVLRQWEIVKTENISMKYKNLPKPPEQNSNH